MSDATAFHLHDIEKRLSDTFTLKIDNLAIGAGEVFCLLGPTGAGKSTLLRLLSGLDDLSSGAIYFDGHAMTSADLPLDTRRQIAVVHQHTALLTGTVKSNVEFGLRLRGKKDNAAAVSTVLKLFRLEEIADQAAHTLSGGQTQLVGLARALVLEPDVLLLDEPTVNLDPAHVALVEQAVAETQQQRKMTVVWTTHNLFQARRVADRVALLLGGQLVEVAETNAFFDSPADPRTRDFVQGKMIY